MILREFRSGVAAAVCMMFLAGCAASIPTPAPKPVIDRPLSRAIPAPAGWKDVSEKALSPDVEYWLLVNDRSASLILKELQSSVGSVSIASDESIVTAAHISLRLKLAERGNSARITQAPASFTSNPAFAMYSYAEEGLLRRVLVFRKHSRLYELELAQESDHAEFSQYLTAQITFAMAILRD